MRKIRSQKGSVVLFVALALVSLMGFAALVVDVGYLYAYRWKLQGATDAAALAAARDLVNATAAAQQMGHDNGIEDSIVYDSGHFQVTTGCWNGTIYVTCVVSKNAARVVLTSPPQSSFFASVLGITEFGFTTTAVALMEVGMPQILSGGDMGFNGGMQIDEPEGYVNIHSNGNLSVHGKVTISDPGSVTLTATGTVSPSSVGTSGAMAYTIPPVNAASFASSAGTRYSGNTTLNLEDLSGRTGVVYVDGNLTIDSSHSHGGGAGSTLSNVTVVSTGTMTFRASEISGATDSSGGVSVYFVSGGDMTFLGSVDLVGGAVFRSTANITLNGGGGVDLNGAYMIADGSIRFNGHLHEINYPQPVTMTNPPFQLPGISSRLVL